MTYKIRQVKPADADVIRQVVAAAFDGKSYADEQDQHIVGQLRDTGALVLSLVAVAKDQVVGQVALSPATIGDHPYLCVGPLAVLPAFQGMGIGTDLLEHAIAVAKGYGRDGLVLQGDPAFYGRVGFRKIDTVTYEGNGAEYVQVLPFGSNPVGTARFHPALSG